MTAMNETQLKEFVESLERVAPGLPIPALPLRGFLNVQNSPSENVTA